MLKKKKPKIIAVIGPTAVGKSSVAVRLAKKFNGEVVSTDSRQVYRGLNIGTGKITKREMQGVPHHLLDVANPKRQFSVAKYKELAEKAIDEILARGKVPVICGGTGFYIQAVVDGILPPPAPPNQALRKRLAQKTTNELFAILRKLDLARAANIDPNNPYRLIRAIEIATALGKVPKIKPRPKYDVLQIGITLPKEKLRARIRARLQKRLRQGMLAEARRLHRKGLSWKRMDELGLEYRYLAKYLKSEMTKSEMVEKLEVEIWRYAKRQMTWFRRDKKIKWFLLTDKEKIVQTVSIFLR